MDTHKFAHALRSEVTDSVTGFSGVIMSACNYLTGCDRYSIQPKELKDGRPQDPYWIEEWRLGEPKEGQKVSFKYATGSLVKDAVTGVEGIIVGRIAQPKSDNRYSVVPRGQKTLDESQKWLTFDEAQITLKKAVRSVLEKPVAAPGGPSRYDAPKH